MLNALLTAHLPFYGHNPATLINMMRTNQPLPASAFGITIDPGLEKLIMTAVTQDQSLRQKKQKDFTSTLQHFVTGSNTANQAKLKHSRFFSVKFVLLFLLLLGLGIGFAPQIKKAFDKLLPPLPPVFRLLSGDEVSNRSNNQNNNVTQSNENNGDQNQGIVIAEIPQNNHHGLSFQLAKYQWAPFIMLMAACISLFSLSFAVHWLMNRRRK